MLFVIWEACLRQHLKECIFDIFHKGIAMYVLAIRIPPGNRSRDQIPCIRIISRMLDIVRMWKLLAGKMTTFEKISALVTISYIHRIVCYCFHIYSSIALRKSSTISRWTSQIISSSSPYGHLIVAQA